MSIKDFNKQTVTNLTFEAATRPIAPTISGYTISGSDDTALDPAGGQTILVNGSGFRPGATITMNNVSIAVVTFVNVDQLSFTSPTMSAGTYNLFVVNTDNGAAILAPGIVYSTFPTWTTAQGTLGSYYETQSINNTVVASGDAPITYTLVSGSLPSGASLSSVGVITGTSPVDNSSTTYSFTIKADDAESQSSTRNFSLTINTDVVTWVTPSSGATINLDGTAYSQALSATDAAGYSVSYTANALPTGLTLSSGTISGTASAEGTTTTLLTATAATTNRTGTNTITWVVALGDIYWKNVSLLLSGSTPTPTFINDASLNNSQLTIQGDTKPNNFNPYSGNYYSNYFDGTGDAINAGTNAAFAFGTGQFCIEAWIFNNVLKNYSCLVTTRPDNGSYADAYHIGWDSVGGVSLYVNTTSSPGGAAGTIKTGVWQHFVCCRDSSNVTSIFVDGVRVGTATITANFTRSLLGIGDMPTTQAEGINGYISNLRLVKGYSVYDPTLTSLTVPTGPLQTIPGTSILSCQYNRFMDNSLNQNTLTRIGNVTVSPAHPFATPTTISYNTQYSTYFDGTGDYLSTPTTTGFGFGTGTFTFECWVYPTSNPTNGPGTVMDCRSGTNAEGWVIRVFNNLTVGIYNGPGNAYVYSTGTVTMNSWNHIAVVRSSTSTGGVAFYINGVASGTGTVASNLGTTWAGKIGTNYSAGYDFNGIISNLRVTKEQTLYTTSFTPSTTPLTAVSGTSLLTCQDSTLKDNSTNNFAITSAGDARPIAVSPFTMTTSSTAVTSLGSAYFDGTGDYLTIPSSPTHGALGTSDFTLELWFNTVVLTGIAGASIQYIISHRLGGIVPYLFWIEANGVLKMYASTDNGSWNLQNGTTLATITTNQWYHFAYTRNGSNFKVFLNGVQVLAFTSASAFTATTNTLNIGGSVSDTNAIFYGYIADVRFVKGTAPYTSNFLPPQAPLTPVTNTQLLTCQTNGGATNNGFVDQSSFNNIITRNGNTAQGTFSPFSQTGWSNYFDGSGDSLTVTATGSTFGTENFTIECWVFRTGAGTDESIFVQGVGGSSGYGLAVLGLKFRVRTPGIQDNSKLTGDIATRGTWHHVALVRNSGTTSLYFNGTSVMSFADTSSETATAWNIGHYGSNDYVFNGYISNLRVVTGTALYTSDFTPSTTPLTAVAKTTLLTCQSNRLIDNSPNNFTITKAGNVSVQAYSPFGGVTSVPTSYSNYFDGSGDYLTASASAMALGSADFTFETWVNFAAMPTSDNWPTAWSSHAVLCEIGTAGQSDGFSFIVGSTQMFCQNNDTKYGTAAHGMVVGQWYHLAYVRVSNTIYFYVNGIQKGSVSFSGSVGTGAFTFIGSETGEGAYLNGYMSNLRLVKDTAIYTSNFTPSTTPLTAVANTSLLTCQNATLIDNSTNKFTLTAAGNVKPIPFNPFGNTTTTNVSYTPSVNGGSMYFDGNGDYLTIPYSSYFDIPTSTSVTFECWVYTTSANTFVIAGRNWSYGGSGPTWAFFLNNGVTPSWGIAGTGSATYVMAVSTISGVLGQWNHYAFTRDSSNVVRIFVNGVVGVSRTDSQAMSASSGAVYIATPSNNAVYSTGYMSGMNFVSGVALYTSNFVPEVSPAIPTPRIGATTYSSTLLLNGTSGGIIDWHGTNNLETVGNTQLASEDPYYGSYYSNYFDGTGDYLTTQQVVPLTGDFTVEGWFNLDFLTTRIDIFNQNLQGTSSEGRLFISISSANAYKIEAFVGGTTGAPGAILSSTVISPGTWYHYAYVRNSNTFSLYINGVREGTQPTGTISIAAQNATIGYNQAQTTYFNGYLSNFRVCNTAVYTTNFTTSTTPLTAISGTSLLTCQSNSFKDNSTNNFTITRSGDTKVKSMNPFQNNTGKSLYFDGTGDYLYAGYTPNYQFGTSDYTIEYWVNPTSFSVLAVHLDFRTSNAATGGALQIYTTTGGVVTVYGGSSTATLLVTAGAGIALGAWTHIAITRSGTSTKLFINGTQSGSTATDSTSYGLGTIWLGTIASAGNSFFTGYMKDFRITKGVARTITVPTSPYKTK